MIATRRERDSLRRERQSYGDADLFRMYCPFPTKKCDNCNTMLKNVVTIAYRNIYYYKKICYNKCKE